MLKCITSNKILYKKKGVNICKLFKVWITICKCIIKPTTHPNALSGILFVCRADKRLHLHPITVFSLKQLFQTSLQSGNGELDRRITPKPHKMSFILTPHFWNKWSLKFFLDYRKYSLKLTSIITNINLGVLFIL